ncbi:MAG: hypothetical protein L6Q98_08385 [Anaerolineae bacterium]|nr:hypothetical protein [Anaerolineae bacterium]NUQ02606.1 hypothetical protein [Anaerolineae bacterium]
MKLFQRDSLFFTFILLASLLIVIALLSGAAPTLAQSADLPLLATNTPTMVPTPPTLTNVVPDPLPGIPGETFSATIIALTLIVLGLIGALAYGQGKSIQALYQSLPPEATAFLRAVLEIIAQKADVTPTPLDDAALHQLLTSLGYDLQRTTDGRIILIPTASRGPISAGD